MTSPASRAKPIPDRTHLSKAEVALLLRLHEAGKTQTEIAHIVGCSQPTVSQWLSSFADTRTAAKLTLNKGAETLAQRVIREASVDQSLDVLERLEVIQPRAQAIGGGGVLINIGMPGHPAGPDPLVNVRANYQTQRESVGQAGQALTGTEQGQLEAKGGGESPS